MLTFLHIVYSKNRTEAWGYCAAKKKQERYKKCGSHDDQSWHVTVRKVRVWKGYFCNWLRKNLLTLTSSPHWTTIKYWPPPAFLFPLLQFQKKIPPINMSRSWFYLFGVRKLNQEISLPIISDMFNTVSEYRAPWQWEYLFLKTQNLEPFTKRTQNYWKFASFQK